jgi:hypothetical protein
MMRFAASGVALVFSLAAATATPVPDAAGVALADDIRVTPLVAEGRVLASFAAPSAFSEDARVVMQSGLLLTFTYTLELRRPATIWFDRTMSVATVAAQVKFDTLTRLYQVTKQTGTTVVWSARTPDDAQVRTWMTTFERVPLDVTEPLEPNADYYVRVRLHATPKRTFSIWPWGHDDATGRADFTFIR